MDNEATITLHCVRKDGRRETTKMTGHSLADARELAKWVLHIGNRLYKEVDLCTEDGYVEKVQNPSTTDTVWMT